MLARGKGNFHAPGKDRPCDPPVQWLQSPIFIVFGGSRVRFSPGVRKVLLSQASMVSPPFKLKMFTGSVCVLRASVSLKLITIKIELIYATTSSWEKKQNGGWKVSDADWFFFSFYHPSWFFYDPSWSNPDWWSELIRSDFCTCLIKNVWFFFPLVHFYGDFMAILLSHGYCSTHLISGKQVKS